MGCDVEEFLDTAHLAGFEFSNSGIQEHTKLVEQSVYMLKTLEAAIEMLRNKHKFGEMYYWILYYSFLSPKPSKNTEEIINKLMSHIETVSYRTYFRKKRKQ